MKNKKLFQDEPVKVDSFKDLLSLKDIYSRYQKVSYNCSLCGKNRITTIYNLVKNNRFEKCSKCLMKENNKKTIQKRYGVDNPNQVLLFKNKLKKTCLEKYGVDNPLKSKNIKEKIRKTCKDKYGNSNVNSLQFKKDKCKKTCLEKYGVPYIFQNEDLKNKSKKTCLEKYGKECITQSQYFKDKTRETCLKNYGVEKAVQSDIVKNKRKSTISNFTKEKRIAIENKRRNTLLQKYGKSNYHNIKKQQETCLKKYGVLSWSQTKDSHSFHKKTYLYENIFFDSKPELSFWIYCKDNFLDIKKSKTCFDYTYNNIKHFYFPDFEINNDYYEIKGDQFLKESKEWQNPYNHNQDKLYEAKHQCALANNVKILYSKDYKKYLDYIDQKYGKNFLDQFKVKKQNKDALKQSSKVEEIK